MYKPNYHLDHFKWQLVSLAILAARYHGLNPFTLSRAELDSLIDSWCLQGRPAALGHALDVLEAA